MVSGLFGTARELPRLREISMVFVRHGLGDLVRRLCGLRSELFHFCGNDGKSAACFAGPSRFDGGIQGQQVGLTGDGINQRHDISNASCRRDKHRDALIRGLCLHDGLSRNARRGFDLPPNLTDR